MKSGYPAVEGHTVERTSALNLLVGSLFFGLLLALVLIERRPTRSAAWMLLRCLVPSWRFFDAVGSGPRLCVRVATAGADFGPWRILSSAPVRGFRSLLLNPRGNLYLAYQSLVERLLDDLDGQLVDHARELVSYRLVRRLIESTLRPTDGAELRYQFSLTDAESAEPLFASETHRMDEP